MAADFFTTEKRTLGVVLSNTTPPLRVPDYQRDFSWEDQQVSEFWYDLSHFDEAYPGNNINGKEYFLGAAVFVNNQTFHLILDGQQRLATATILLAALRDKILEYKGDAADQVQSTFISFQDHLTGDHSPKLQLNEYDRAFFRDSFQTFPRNAAAVPGPRKRSHKLILKAYEYFSDQIRQAWDSRGGGEQGFKWAARIVKTLTDHVSLVAVVSTDEDNAASIFETLNDRGIGLSTADLLRSWLLRNAPPTDREEIIGCWSEVFDSAGIGEGAETLIRLSWVSRHGDVKERSLYRVISRNLRDTRTSSVNYSRQLRDDALLYRRVRDGDTSDGREREIWLGLPALRAQSAYAPLIAACRVLGDDPRRRISVALFSLIVRHNIICDRDRAKFETTAFAAAKTLSDSGNEQGALAQLRALSPSDADVRNNFSNLAFGRSQTGAAHIFLRALEYTLRRTDELIVATPDRVHLEHIYPQRPDAANRLVDHDQRVGLVGNLTLLSRKLNQEAQNLPFADKKGRFYNQSELFLNQALLNFDNWTPADIEGRQAALCDLAIQTWPENLTGN